MAFDQSKVGQLTAALMESLDDQYGEDCEFGDLMLIAEVLGPHGSSLSIQVSQPRKHINLGLLAAAERVIDGS
jgi:hypothetical protein